MNRIDNDDLQHILSKTQQLWQEVRGKKIFITGGTGFFGKWLLESFLYINQQLELNAQFIVLTRNPDSFIEQFPFYHQHTEVKFLKGDLLTFEFPEESFDYIVHAATEADALLNKTKPLVMLDTITEGTRRILDFAMQQPALKSLLFTSSGAVYGKQPENITHIKENEYHPVDINNPANAYAEGKRLAELYCSIYAINNKLPVKIARCFAFVGPYLPLNKHFAVGNFILNAINNEDIIIKGDGTPYRSYLYAADLAVWLWTILFKGDNNKPYNVGSDDAYSIKELAQLVQQTNTNINVVVQGVRDESKPIERYVPDVQLAKTELGLSVDYDINKSIQKTKSFN